MQTVKTNLVMSHTWDYSPDVLREVWVPALYSWHTSSKEDTESAIFVRQIEVQIEAPDNFDPTASQVAALLREKERIGAEFAAKIAEVNERLSKLQAIEHTDAS